jgi:N-dimethylarginine dimethylaminohydrolase
MKVDFAGLEGGAPVRRTARKFGAHVAGETDILTDVLLCPPHHLAPVPCCAVTRGHLDQGHVTDVGAALRQHRALVSVLEADGVRCHMLPPRADLPDMCFTRDIGVATPWGLVALNPAMPHRRGEVDALLAACADGALPVRRIVEGTIEGGDICIAREGLLIVGLSGERTSHAGVEAFAAPFRAAGWDVLLCPFHADHLHLDTIFCMIDRDEAIGCLDLLDPGFVAQVRARGITILPMPSAMAASLGCNILSLGRRRIVASAADDALAATLRDRGYHVRQVDIAQFAACGGGIHCLTQPLRRIAA